MSKLIIMAKLRLSISFSNRKQVLLMLLLPIIIVLIISSIFSRFSSELTIPIGIVDEDQSPMTKRIIEKLKSNKSLIVNELNEAEALSQVESNKIEAYFVFDENFEDNIKALNYEESVSIHYLDKNFIAPSLMDLLAKDILYEISYWSVHSKVYQYTKNLDHARSGTTMYEKLINEDEFQMDILYKYKNSNAINTDFQTRDILGFKITLGFGITFLTLILFFSISQVITDTVTRTGDRLQQIGLSRIIQFWGNYIGIWLYSSLFTSVFVTALGTFTLEVQWRHIPTVFTYIMFFNGFNILIGLLLCQFVVDKDRFQRITVPLVFCFSLIGGGIWPLDMFPQNFQLISSYTHFNWAIKVISEFVF